MQSGIKVLVTGVGGQLGFDVYNELSYRGMDVTGTDILDSVSGITEYVRLDITDRAAVRKLIIGSVYNVVIHCAAWTAVDLAEEPQNREKVMAINSDACGYIAEAVSEVDGKMVYISTDYVFDGSGTEPHQPDSTDYSPLNVYGLSKLGGEQAVKRYLKKFFVVRTEWVYGLHGHNFVKTMIKIGKQREEVKVVSDQIGTPTYTPNLAVLLADMIVTDRYGYYNATDSEREEGAYISWADFATKIYEFAGMNTKVSYVSTSEYGASKATRPFNSRLDKSKLTAMGFKPLPVWDDSLAAYIDVLRREGFL